MFFCLHIQGNTEQSGVTGGIKKPLLVFSLAKSLGGRGEQNKNTPTLPSPLEPCQETSIKIKNPVQNVISMAETACTVEPKQALAPVYSPVLDKAVKKVLTAYAVVQVLIFVP